MKKNMVMGTNSVNRYSGTSYQALALSEHLNSRDIIECPKPSISSSNVRLGIATSVKV